VAGRLFHKRGPATEKLRSPNVLCDLGTTSVRLSADRSRRRPVLASATYLQSSVRYVGVAPSSDLNTSTASLNGCVSESVASGDNTEDRRDVLTAAGRWRWHMQQGMLRRSGLTAGVE
jgi:hypothetical protein